MTRTWTMGLALAGLLLLPAPLLRADDPPKEKPKKPKVYTEDDLRAGRRKGTLSTPEGPASEGTAGAEKKDDKAAAKAEPTEEERRQQRRSELQEEINFQLANIASYRKQAADAQTELNDLTDMTYAVPGTTTGRRTALMRLIDEANAEIKKAQDTIEQLAEQARREGISVSRP